MKPWKKMIVGGLVPAAVLTISLFISTHYAAKSLAYQRPLGPPLRWFKGLPLYNPTSIISWYYHFHGYAPKQFSQALIFTYAGFFIAGSLALFIATRPGHRKVPTSHGTAKWAERENLAQAKLLDGKGVILGVSKDNEYLRHDGPEHVICMAPTRSGKGVGIIIPTLLSWPHSVVVIDIKGENWGITSGYRKDGLNNWVMKFDPTDATGLSAHYNPLEEIRIGTKQEVKDTQNIADILVDPQGTGQMDHWSKTGHALLVGAILHVMYSKDIHQKTLSAIATCLSNPEKTIDQTLQEMLTANHDPDHEFGWLDISGRSTGTHPVVAAAARELLNKSENERSGVLSTAMSFLGLYRDPIVSANTERSDFRITDLMNADHPLSLYLVVPPSDLSRTRPLMRMIINQIGRTLTESMEFENGRPKVQYRHRLLLLLDEFSALGRLDFFESALAFIAGYGLKALLIVQSLNQLNKAYTRDNAILDNCHIRVVFTPNDLSTAELISKMLSQKTETIRGESYSGERSSFFLKNVSRFTQEIARPLMTAGEVLMLSQDEEIIFCAGIPPIKGLRLRYFEDGNFTKRLYPPPVRSDCIPVNQPLAKTEPIASEATGKEEDNDLESRVAADLAFEAKEILETLEAWRSVEVERENMAQQDENLEESDEYENADGGLSI